MENMYGNVAYQQKYLTVKTYSINGDEYGVLYSLLRLVQTALRVLGISVAATQEGATQPIHKLWIAALYAAFASQTVDLGEISRELHLYQGMQLLTIFNLAIQSLPPYVQLRCFSQHMECVCGQNEDVIVPVDTKLNCSGCGRQVAVAAVPKIAITTATHGLHFGLQGAQFQLLSACATQQGACSQLLCDLFCQKREMAYLLHTVKRNQVVYQIPDLVYLEHSKAAYWISGTQCKAAQRFGQLYIFFYIDMRHAESVVRQNADAIFNQHPDTPIYLPAHTPSYLRPTSILKTPKYVYSPVVDSIHELPNYPSAGSTSPLAADSSSSSDEQPSIYVIEELYYVPKYTHKTISIFDLQPAMIALLVGIAILLVIDVALASVLTQRITNVMPINNLIVSEKAYLGVDPAANVQNISRKAADPSSYYIITASLHARQLNITDATSPSASFVALQTPNADLPGSIRALQVDNLQVGTFDSYRFTLQSSLDFAANITASGLYYSTLNYEYFACSGTLSAQEINTTVFETANLNVTYYSKVNYLTAQSANVTQQTINYNATSFGSLTVSSLLQVNDSINVANPIVFDGKVAISNTLQLNDGVSLVLNYSTFSNTNLSLVGYTITVNSMLNATSLRATTITSPLFTFRESYCTNCNSLNVVSLNISNTLTTEQFVHTGVNSTIQNCMSANSTLVGVKIGGIELNSSGLFGYNATATFNVLNISEGALLSAAGIAFNGTTVFNASAVSFTNYVTGTNGVFKTIACDTLTATNTTVSGAANCTSAGVPYLTTNGDYTLGQIAVNALSLKLAQCATAGMLCSSRHCSTTGCKIFENVNSDFQLRGDVITGDMVCYESSSTGANGGCWL